MSRTVEWGISPRQYNGIKKIAGLILNMIQDHDVQVDYTICEQEWSLREIHSQVVFLANRGTYNQKEREFLNEVRNLVLQYQRLDKRKKETMPWDDPSYEGLPFFINSKGQINHNLTTLSNGVR